MPNALYITQLNQTYLGKNMVTTWNIYDADTGVNGLSFAVASYFISDVLPAINAMQNDRVFNRSIYTRCPTYGTDSHFGVLTGGGARASAPADLLPAYLTCGVRWAIEPEDQYGPRPTLIKRSFSRFAGLRDGDVTNGEMDDDFFATYIVALSNAWCEPVALGGGDYYPSAHVNPTQSATDWKITRQVNAMSIKLGTQNTRK